MRSKRFADAHAVLGLSPGATAADVKRAYRRRARLLHPDVAGPEATSRMAELNLARDAIMAGMPPTFAGDAEPAAGPQQRQRSGNAGDHASAWEDYWASWNEPAKRGDKRDRDGRSR